MTHTQDRELILQAVAQAFGELNRSGSQADLLAEAEAWLPDFRVIDEPTADPRNKGVTLPNRVVRPVDVAGNVRRGNYDRALTVRDHLVRRCNEHRDPRRWQAAPLPVGA